jgi:hypothetical protein
VCTTCKKPFPDGNFYERDGKPYCKIDYEKNACVAWRRASRQTNTTRGITTRQHDTWHTTD